MPQRALTCNGKMKIPLTAGQSVTIHGWMNPKPTLSWGDVLANERLSFTFLNAQVNIPSVLLHRLQPDIGAWVSAKRVDLLDVLMLAPWGAHPMRDLKADLGDLVHTGWRAHVLRGLGVTYTDLVEAGMTPESMILFGYTLYDWSTLGFSESDAASFSAPVLGRLFGLTRADVSRCFINGKGAPKTGNTTSQ